MQRSCSDAEKSTPPSPARRPTVPWLEHSLRARAPDAMLNTSAQPGLEPPQPLARLWRLQAWLGLAKQGHPRGRGRRTWPQDAQVNSENQHSRTSKFPSRKRRTPAGVRAAARSESRARVHAAVAAGRTGPSLVARNSRAACGCLRECPWLPGPWELGILTGMLTNSLTAHKNFVKLGIWPHEAH